MRMSRFLIVVAIFGLLVGCDAKSSSSSSSSGDSSDSEKTDPKAIAAKMDKFAAEELAKSKLPAKAWLAEPTHGTFKAKKTDVMKLVDDVTAAGAPAAYVGEPETLEGKQLVDHLFIELPTD